MAEPQRQTFKDANGRTLGRSVTDTRGNTTYYDSMGRTTGRSVTDTGATRRSTIRSVATPDGQPPTATRQPSMTTSVVAPAASKGAGDGHALALVAVTQDTTLVA